MVRRRRKQWPPWVCRTRRSSYRFTRIATYSLVVWWTARSACESCITVVGQNSSQQLLIRFLLPFGTSLQESAWIGRWSAHFSSETVLILLLSCISTLQLQSPRKIVLLCCMSALQRQSPKKRVLSRQHHLPVISLHHDPNREASISWM